MKMSEVGKICYECCEENGWNFENILFVYRKKALFYDRLPNITRSDIKDKALNYVKKNIRLNVFYDHILNKCDRRKAEELFNLLVPGFNDIESFYDFCYDLIENHYSKKNIIDFAVETGLSEKSIEDYARLSKDYDGYLTIDDNENKLSYFKDKYKSHFELIEYLLDAKDLDDIFEYMDNQKEKFDYDIIQKIVMVCFPKMNKGMFDAKIGNRLKAYDKYNTQRQDFNRLMGLKKDKIKYAIKMISKFINDKNNSPILFMQREELNKAEFNYLVAIVKNNNIKLYHQYQKSVELDNEQDLINYVKELIRIIQSGGKEFNLYNFCQISKLSLEDFYWTSLTYNKKNAISSSEHKIAWSIYRKYHNARVMSYNEIMNDKIEVNCERDKDGFPIPGTGHVVTTEEKQKIVDEMDSMMCNKYYNYVFDYLLKQEMQEKGFVKRK